MNHEPTGYHEPLNVDKPERSEGAWMCSAWGMNSQAAPLAASSKFPRGPVLSAVGFIFLLALVVWLVRFFLQR